MYLTDTSQKTKNGNISANGRFFSKPGVITDLLLITFLWCLTVVIVNPVGNFPLNDDWSYGIAVQRLVEMGIYHPTGWTSMPLITQALWGAIFCIPCGFSFTVLRISTLLLSLIGICSFYLLIRLLNIPRWLSIIFALTLAFNPVYFALSYTFMTDVPFTAFCVLSLLFLVKSLHLNSDFDLIIGVTLAIIAILCRQLGLFIPIAFCLTILIKHGFSWKSFLRAVIPLVIALFCLVGFQKWLEVSGVLPEEYFVRHSEVWNILRHPQLSTITINVYIILQYIGLYLAPIVFLLPKTIFLGIKQARKISYIMCLLPLGISIVLFFNGNMMPLAGNVLIKEGIGPITLRDTYILKLPHLITLPTFFWVVVTLISAMSSGLLLSGLYRLLFRLITNLNDIVKTNHNIIPIFLLIGSATYFIIIALVFPYDRYYIQFIIIISAAIVSIICKEIKLSINKIMTVSAMLILGCFILFSVATTRDYIEFNRVRWLALRNLMDKEKITPSQIDGGFEFNGFYLYDYRYRSISSKSFWWVDKDDYIITLGKIQHYEVFRQYYFFHWFPPRRINIMVMNRVRESKINLE